MHVLNTSVMIQLSFIYLCVFHVQCRHNIRDIFEIYSQESNVETIDELIKMGERNVKNLRVLTKIDEETWRNITDDRKLF